MILVTIITVVDLPVLRSAVEDRVLRVDRLLVEEYIISYCLISYYGVSSIRCASPVSGVSGLLKPELSSVYIYIYIYTYMYYTYIDSSWKRMNSRNVPTAYYLFIYVFTYHYDYMCLHIISVLYIYIYIYIEREREIDVLTYKCRPSPDPRARGRTRRTSRRPRSCRPPR